jgi:hypothetical protein
MVAALQKKFWAWMVRKVILRHLQRGDIGYARLYRAINVETAKMQKNVSRTQRERYLTRLFEETKTPIFLEEFK